MGKHSWRQLGFVAVILSGCERTPSTPDINSHETESQPMKAVTVFAASSLQEAVEEIAGAWSQRTGRFVQLRFDATSILARQIVEGAPADVFLAAAPEWLERVRPIQRFDWLSNRLVVVVRKGAGEVNWKTVQRFALANEQVPAGSAARAALRFENVGMPPTTIHGSSVRDILSKVSHGGADAGIVYATDAAIDPDLRIAHVFPAESHPRIVYSVGLLNVLGEEFYEALRRPCAVQIAKSRGFLEVP
jgi:molybdate transport system substrate-binding protein